MKTSQWFAKAGRFVRSYTSGMGGDDVQRLFDRDAREAFAVVTRGHDQDDEPGSGFWRFVYRARILLLSLSFRLSPPRRLVFAVCVALASWSLVDVAFGQSTILHPVLLVFVAFAGLVFLLLLATDGVVETLNPSGVSYGFDRLQDILAAGGSCREVHDRVLEDVDSYRGDEPIHDDRSLVVIERWGA